jgi:hypothetical protein
VTSSQSINRAKVAKGYFVKREVGGRWFARQRGAYGLLWQAGPFESFDVAAAATRDEKRRVNRSVKTALRQVSL